MSDWLLIDPHLITLESKTRVIRKKNDCHFKKCSNKLSLSVEKKNMKTFAKVLRVKELTQLVGIIYTIIYLSTIPTVPSNESSNS